MELICSYLKCANSVLPFSAILILFFFLFSSSFDLIFGQRHLHLLGVSIKGYLCDKKECKVQFQDIVLVKKPDHWNVSLGNISILGFIRFIDVILKYGHYSSQLLVLANFSWTSRLYIKKSLWTLPETGFSSISKIKTFILFITSVL